MRVWIIAAALLLAQLPAFPQSLTIVVQHAAARKGALLALSGETSTLIDSVTAGDGGMFKFEFDRHRSAGIYRLALDNRRVVDFVLDGEDVKIETDSLATPESLMVVRSESNRLYYQFRLLNQRYKRKLEILQLVLARYPREENYYQDTRKATDQLQKEYLGQVQEWTATRPSSFVSRYIRSAQLPIVDMTVTLEEQIGFQKAHGLDSVDFSDEGLIHSDLFTSKSIEYLTYYRNPQLPKDLLAKEFNIAIDSILNRAKVNLDVYRHITEYLVDGFKQFGFEECINYIVDNYVIKDDLCLEESGNAVQRMIQQRKELVPGVRAPEIVLPDTSGSIVSLTEIRADRILIVFYSTSCPHCQTMIPELSQVTKGMDNGLSVLAVSLDTNSNDWLGFVRAHGFSWTDVIDMQGWDGNVALGYFIYATPTMILLDKDKKIIGKPTTIAELQNLL